MPSTTPTAFEATPLAVASPTATRPRVSGKFLFVDDQKFYVKGVSYGAFRPDAQKREYWDFKQIERDFAQMAANGINTVRIPHTMPPRTLLDIAQTHGLHVMVGLSAEQYVGFLIDRGKKRPDVGKLVRQKVRTVAGHPALLCYGLGNEIPASVARWLGAKKIERYLRRLYDAVKAEDPEGIVTYVNYPSTEYLQLPFLDAVCFNVYLEREDRFRAYLARLQNIAGDRPLLMSEIGLDALRNGEGEQARALHWQIRATFTSGCAGVVLFSWTDEWHRAGEEVEDWAFGITDRERRPKPALDAVRLAFGAVPFSMERAWPRISVVICVYNSESTLRETLEAMERVSYPDFETIVVNDGSTDGTEAIAAEYGCRLISTANNGLSHARNVGMNAATGEIVAFLDGDAMPDEHWLQYLAHAFLTTPHAAIGGPNIPPPHSGDVAKCVSNAPGGPVHVLLDDETAEHLPGCNLAVRRSCLLEVGGFDPLFRVAGDDVDLCWRLQERGWTLGFAPGALVWHHRRSTVRDYWRQQKGYGKAEGLLAAKWPECFNSAGHHTFAGRIYGRGITHAFFRRPLVYHGSGGFAPFQSLYERAPGVMASLPLMPEWYILIVFLVGVSALGFLWAPLFLAWVLAALAVAPTLSHALAGGWGANFGVTPPVGLRAVTLRGRTTCLYLMQPLARLCGRLGSGLTTWRGCAAPGFVFPRCISSAIWTEDRCEPSERLRRVCLRLHEEGNSAKMGGDYVRWDIEVLGGMFGSARLMMAVEDHGAGAQYVRTRISPRCRAGAKLALLLFGFLTLLAASAHQPTVTGVFSACSLLLALRTLQQEGQASAALCRALSDAKPHADQ